MNGNWTITQVNGPIGPEIGASKYGSTVTDYILGEDKKSITILTTFSQGKIVVSNGGESNYSHTGSTSGSVTTNTGISEYEGTIGYEGSSGGSKTRNSQTENPVASITYYETYTLGNDGSWTKTEQSSENLLKLAESNYTEGLQDRDNNISGVKILKDKTEFLLTPLDLGFWPYNRKPSPIPPYAN
ncbi:hypothetical protein [Pontibacter sp. G13]|uniref:hypothetical protein n=1 Tax=Pontibacter sp. G13 TaxID=3074898 RepID=UPI0028891BC3|nr:hypothetical protein [Pontibacter sp. G13]WNJ17206.1 hypothetical protein RJD25_20310 [Pontibacter sp. G13]